MLPQGDLTAVWVPDAAHEALRDLVRAREDAQQDQQRARQRLGKFLLRRGAQAPVDIKKKWTAKYRTWLHDHVHFEQPAREATLADYVHEVHHAGERMTRLEKAIDEASAKAPEQIRSVIAALQALRGVAQITAVTVVAVRPADIRVINRRIGSSLSPVLLLVCTRSGNPLTSISGSRLLWVPVTP